MRRIAAAAIGLFTTIPLFAQTASDWTFKSRIELRANYRDSKEEKFALKFLFRPSQLPVGQTVGFEETVDAGSHAELSVAQIKLDLGYSTWFLAHTQLHGQDKYRRNPTSADRKVDADELGIQHRPSPECLAPPERSLICLSRGRGRSAPAHRPAGSPSRCCSTSRMPAVLYPPRSHRTHMIGRWPGSAMCRRCCTAPSPAGVPRRTRRGPRARDRRGLP